MFCPLCRLLARQHGDHCPQLRWATKATTWLWATISSSTFVLMPRAVAWAATISAMRLVAIMPGEMQLAVMPSAASCRARVLLRPLRQNAPPCWWLGCPTFASRHRGDSNDAALSLPNRGNSLSQRMGAVSRWRRPRKRQRRIEYGAGGGPPTL